MRRRVRIAVVAVIALSVVANVSHAAVALQMRAAYDRSQVVGAVRLNGALQTFRPFARSGQAEPVDLAALSPALTVRTEPARCSALTLLAVRAPVDGASWIGINGSPAQPVKLLTVRYPDASAARADLWDKRRALRRCHSVRLVFPPFDQPAQTYTVHPTHRLRSAVGDRVSYDLAGADKSYGFYVRQYANTLTWTYGDDTSTPQVRQQVADSLVERLRELRRG